MEQAPTNQRNQGTTRRAFLKQVLELSSVAASAALLNACGSPAATATAVPAVEPPTTLPANLVAPTTAATAVPAATSAVVAPTIAATSASSASGATASSVAAAEAFLATLDDSKRASVQFEFSDNAQRVNWSNFPTGIFQRAGLRMGDLSEAQQTAAMALLAATLSQKGYQQVVDTVNGDEVLKNSGSNGQLVFGKAEYYISLLGTPSVTTPWMWQFGGHHLAINATIVGEQIVLTPSLTGGQPASYTLNGQTVRPLGAEDDAAFALINALDADQQKQAILGTQYIDLVLGPGQDGKVLQPEGIKATDLNADQQTKVFALVQERVGLLNDASAAAKMAEIKANIADTYFAWSGPITAGSAAYYRVQGPTMVIEYSPQSMGGDAAAHIHAMYRDPTNDYAAALTK